jgi:hypothetical protein
VVCRRPCLVLAAACGGRDTRHTGATRFLVVAAITVGHGCDPLEMLLVSLLAAPRAIFGVLGGDVGRHPLPLIRVTSLLPRVGRSLVSSFPVAYWAATLHSSLVAYLKMLVGARKGGASCVSCMPLPDTFTSALLESGQCLLRLLCLPKRGFRTWCSGCTPLLRTCRRTWGSMRWPRCPSVDWGEKSVDGVGDILVTEGSMTAHANWPRCTPC